MKQSRSLPLFTEMQHGVSIPRYSIRLVKESEIFYEHKKINGAKMVCDLLQAIGLHEKAGEELHSFYLNTKNEIIGMEMISKGTLNVLMKMSLLCVAYPVYSAHVRMVDAC